MRKIMRFAAATLIAAAAFAAVANNAANAYYFTYTSGIQVQNLAGSNANVVITFYDSSGSTPCSISDSITANGSKTYFPLSQCPAGFNGSAVVSADQQVAAVVNVLGNSGAAGASYIGSQSGNTGVSIPLLMKGNSGYNTWMKVQNVGSSAASVSVAYSDGTNASATVQPGAAATFDQASETHSAVVFAATISSNQPVVATVVEEDPKTMFAYNGFPSGSTNPVMPLINTNNGGIITGIQMQNLGNSDTTVTVSYSPVTNGGTACTETKTIASKQSQTFAFFAFSSSQANENCVDGALFVGSAQVTSNSAGQQLAAIVNQVLANTFGEAYDSFDPTAATNSVVMPLIMDRNFGYYTGFNVMNVGSSNTTVNCSFTNSSYTASATLAPGQALNDLQLNKIGDTYVGSATCTGDSGSKLVGVVNEVNPTAPTNDTLLVYEAISK